MPAGRGNVANTIGTEPHSPTQDTNSFSRKGIFVQARLINMLIGRATIIRNKLMTTATLASEESSAL